MLIFLIETLLLLPGGSAADDAAVEQAHYLILIKGSVIGVVEEARYFDEQDGRSVLVTRLKRRQRWRIGPRPMSSNLNIERVEDAQSLHLIRLSMEGNDNGWRSDIKVEITGGAAVLTGLDKPVNIPLPQGRPVFYRQKDFGELLKRRGLLHEGGRAQVPVLIPEKTGIALVEANVERKTAAGFLIKITNLLGGVDSPFWFEECDAEGRLLLYKEGVMQKRRVPEEEAHLPAVPPNISNRVDAGRPPPGLNKRDSVLMHLEGEVSPGLKLVPESPYCRVTNEDTHGFTLRLNATYPDGSLPSSPLSQKDRANYLAGSHMYQLDHPVIAESLAAAFSGASPPRSDLARTVNITRWVNRRIRNGAGMPPMAPAVAAIKARRGDCTEYAAAAVALLRAAGIPSRMAMGLLYDGVGFQFHAWAEAYIDDRWVPVDAAYKRVGFPPIYVFLGYGDNESALYENRAFRLLSGFRFDFIEHQN